MYMWTNYIVYWTCCLKSNRSKRQQDVNAWYSVIHYLNVCKCMYQKTLFMFNPVFACTMSCWERLLSTRDACSRLWFSCVFVFPRKKKTTEYQYLEWLFPCLALEVVSEMCAMLAPASLVCRVLMFPHSLLLGEMAPLVSKATVIACRWAVIC